MNESADPGRTDRRLRWRSRRGMLELELALAPFVEHCLDALSEEQKVVYARLLDHDDWDIYEWVQGRGAPDDPALDAMVRAISAAQRR